MNYLKTLPSPSLKVACCDSEITSVDNSAENKSCPCFPVTQKCSFTLACCESNITAVDGEEEEKEEESSCFSWGNQIVLERTLPEAKLPSRASSGAAAYDFCSVECKTVLPWSSETFDTGIKIKRMPANVFLKLESRSGLCLNNKIITCAGVIDSDYSDSIKVLLFNLSSTPYTVKPKDRISQGIFMNSIHPRQLNKKKSYLLKGKRGEKGFGSTS